MQFIDSIDQLTTPVIHHVKSNGMYMVTIMVQGHSYRTISRVDTISSICDC